MKNYTPVLFCLCVLLLCSKQGGAQAPNLGTLGNFILFSSNGAVSNTGLTRLTGNVGTNNGSSTGFGNIDGGMHDGDPASIQAAADLLVAYNQLNSAVPAFFPAPLLGNGQTLVAGVYAVGSAATLNGTLLLNAQNNTSAVFIIKIAGSLSTNAAAKVKLLNGAQACNVFWKVEGKVSMATGTTMRGTIIANNAAVEMNTGDTLEGHAFAKTGAVTADGIFGYIPTGCGRPALTGPTAPPLGAVACYALFSASGPVSNAGLTHVTGDVGTNSGLTTGFDSAYVNGTIHPVPDASTAQSATDLAVLYNYLHTLAADIELLYPAQFGNNLVLTPHTYLLDAATVFTDTVFLNAQGNTNAVFVLKINGALSTSTYSTVQLVNGAQAKNVYWIVEGAVGINNYSVFNGTLVCNNGALGALNTGVTINGRALTTTGALTTTAITAAIQSGCGITGVNDMADAGFNETVSIYPNPFKGSFNVAINAGVTTDKATLHLFNALGAQVVNTAISKQVTIITTQGLPAGIYFYRVMDHNKMMQQGRLVAQ